MRKEIYAIEWNGDEWQSVFKSHESEKSQLHTTLQDAFLYMTQECRITEDIVVKHVSAVY